MSPAFLPPAPLAPSRAVLLTTTRTTCPRRAAASPRVPARMHAPTGPSQATPAKPRRRPGEHKGFVEEMRFVAMRLHTKDQAPREGGKEESALPIDAWYPSKHDFLQFLVDSREVYNYFENSLVVDDRYPIFARFRNTGLERLHALDADIQFLQTQGVQPAPPTEAATRYVEYMQKLVEREPESVLCHWYNYYFAHSAGGRMIGRLMQDRLFGGKTFTFYEWEGDVKDHLNKVRVVIDEVAKDWPREVKEKCLKETSLAFGYSGTVLQNLAKASA